MSDIPVRDESRSAWYQVLRLAHATANSARERPHSIPVPGCVSKVVRLGVDNAESVTRRGLQDRPALDLRDLPCAETHETRHFRRLIVTLDVKTLLSR